MNNFIASAQRFLKNKNTVTIIGVIVILILLYWGYSSQINSAVNPIKVPVAAETIQPRTEITDAMVTLVDMPNISITDNVIKSKSLVVGKYSNINSVIPEGSMFYKDTVVDKDDIPDSVYVKVKDGYRALQFKVTTESTYGNTIMPGNKIDIYMKAGDGTDEKLMIGELVTNIEVLAVKDSSGKDVFENTAETRTPALMLVAVPEDIQILLLKATYLDNLGVELLPVPQGGTVTTGGATEVSTQQLVDYIEAHSVNIPITKKTTDTLLPSATVTNNKATMTYPTGCGSTYTCTYKVDYTTVGLADDTGTVTKTSQTITLKQPGTLTMTVKEANGTEHTKTLTLTSLTGTTKTE